LQAVAEGGNRRAVGEGWREGVRRIELAELLLWPPHVLESLYFFLHVLSPDCLPGRTLMDLVCIVSALVVID